MNYFRMALLFLLILAMSFFTLSGAGVPAASAEAVPEKYDLRELGFVSPVKDQGIRGTDSNFAVWDATEISVLSTLGQTYEEYYRSNYRYDPQKECFPHSFEIEAADIRPAVAGTDEKGEYAFNPEGLNAIKTEILSGRGVVISYHADKTMPDPSREETIKKYNDVYETLGLSGPVCDNYTALKLGDRTPDDFTTDELRELIDFRFKINIMSNVSYDLSSMDRDDLKLLLVTPLFPYPIEQVREYSKLPSRIFLNVRGENPPWAQYTSRYLDADHAAVIVGWDDDYSASNFVEEYRPEDDGAFIVKNSWGTSWGLDGYFYLSYYDQTIAGAESFSCTQS